MTWNSADKTSHVVLSNADRTATLDAYSSSGSVRSKYGLSSGKWYAEFYFPYRADSNNLVGFCNLTHSIATSIGSDAESWAFNLIRGSGDGLAYHNLTSVNHSLAVPGEGAMVCIALDLDNKKVWYSTEGGGFWDGDPTDPVSGGFAHSFTSHTEAMYLALYMVWNSTGQSVCIGQFSAEDQDYAPPTGYLPIAEGWPADYVFESGAFSLNGQEIDLTGGYYPVYEDLWEAEFTLNGQPIGKLNAPYESSRIQLDHDLSDSSLILMGTSTGVFKAYCHPDQFNRGASGYLNQLLTGGKWYLSFRNNSPDFINEHPYDDVRCGLIRGTETLNRMLGNENTDDVYMISWGAWNYNMRLFRGGRVVAIGDNTNYNDILGIAVDLTDPTNGRLWVHHDDDWFGSDPVAGTGGFTIVGPWYFAISVRNKFEIYLTDNFHAPAGFTPINTQNQWVTENLWGGNAIVVESSGTMTPVDVRLFALSGNHLLRSATWEKRNYYYLGLLTSLDPLVEVTKCSGGYQRQMITASNGTWDSNFVNLARINFSSCTATVIGWALFWYQDRETGEDDPVVISGLLPEPVELIAGQPGLTITPGSFVWTID